MWKPGRIDLAAFEFDSGLLVLTEASMKKRASLHVIAGRAREHGRITMGDAIRLTDASRNTLKQHFRALTEQNHLQQQGRGRGVWYELK